MSCSSYLLCNWLLYAVVADRKRSRRRKMRFRVDGMEREVVKRRVLGCGRVNEAVSGKGMD